MRTRTLPLVLGLIAACTAWTVAFGGDVLPAAAQALALVGGRLVDGTGRPALEHSVVVIENGKVSAVGQVGAVTIPAGARKIDTTGKTVLPGLINVHVHLSSAGHNDYARWDREFPESRIRAEILPASAKALLASGVTTALDLGGNIDDLLEFRDQIRAGKVPGPRLLVVGPLLCTPKRQFSGSITDADKYWIVNSAEDGRAKVRELVRRGVDAIKLWDDAFGVAELQAIIFEAHAHGLRVAAHLLTLEGIQNAVAAGMSEGDSLEHIGAGPGLGYPDELVREIVRRRIYVSPTLIAFEGLRQIMQNPHVLDDPQHRSMLPRPLYEEIVASVRDADPKKNPIYHYVFDLAPDRASKLRQLHHAGAIFVLGSDSGSRANPHFLTEWREMVLLQTEAGLSNMQVIAAATRVAAQALHLGNEIGTLEVGKAGDAVVIDGNPLARMSDMERVSQVIQGGKPVSLH
jgi:imidazolonepropionase-like amidohydrolase